TRKRRLAAETTELADAVTIAADVIGTMRRQDGLSTRTIIRQLLQELRPTFPREVEFLHDDAMVDALSALMELLEVILRADTVDTAPARHVIGMMEGDPMFAGVVAKIESAIDHVSAGTSVPAGALPPPPPPPSWATIQRLFKENPSPLPDQAPAIEC